MVAGIRAVPENDNCNRMKKQMAAAVPQDELAGAAAAKWIGFRAAAVPYRHL
jgi:hypothetical protein